MLNNIPKYCMQKFQKIKILISFIYQQKINYHFNIIIVSYSLSFKTLQLSNISSNPIIPFLPMNKIQLSQQSLNRQCQFHNDEIYSNINCNMKRSREKQKQQQNTSKQNDSKHINAIRPYIGKERKISKRDSQKNIPVGSPSIYQGNSISGCMNTCENNSRQKNKKTDLNQKKLQQSLQIRNINDLYLQFVTIKNQYKTLKNLYNTLVKENLNLTERNQTEVINLKELKKEIQRYKRDDSENKNNIKFIQEEIQRIKKQCVRMVETEKFKNKKLEETLQEKQLMIAYLRNQLTIFGGDSNNLNANFFFQHTAPTFIRNANNNGIVLQQTSNYHTNLNIEQNINLQSEKDIEFSKNCTNIKNFFNTPPCPTNLPNNQPPYQNNLPNIPPINKSVGNHLVMNSSMVAVTELIDLPRQLNCQKGKKKDGMILSDEVKRCLNSSQIKNNDQVDNYKKIGMNKRQCLILNEDDSLSFSYQKSKQQINQQDYDSVQSFNDPTILTFTKKDVYIFDEDEHEFNRNKIHEDEEDNKQNKSSIVIMDKGIQFKNYEDGKDYKCGKIDSLYASDFEHQQQNLNGDNRQQRTDERSNYGGQQQLLTFENRGAQKKTQQSLYKIINQHKLKQHKKQQKTHKVKRKDKDKIHLNKIFNDEKKDVSSKSKLHTKRLEVYGDDIGYLGDGKQLSAETKKKSINHDSINPKTGKKKLSRKRKSQEGGGSLSKK